MKFDNLVIKLIKIYQKYYSPYKGTKCPYYPSCSEYGLQSVKRFGTVRGLILTFFRIVRCNPFSKGGVDPVPEVNDNYHILIKI